MDFDLSALKVGALDAFVELILTKSSATTAITARFKLSTVDLITPANVFIYARLSVAIPAGTAKYRFPFQSRKDGQVLTFSPSGLSRLKLTFEDAIDGSNTVVAIDATCNLLAGIVIIRSVHRDRNGNPVETIFEGPKERLNLVAGTSVDYLIGSR